VVSRSLRGKRGRRFNKPKRFSLTAEPAEAAENGPLTTGHGPVTTDHRP
jgi:hypothetical protein